MRTSDISRGTARAGAGAVVSILTIAAPPAIAQEILTGGVMLDSGGGIYYTAPGTVQDYDSGDPQGEVGAKVQVPLGAVAGLSAKAVFPASATPTGAVTVRVLRTPPGPPTGVPASIAQCAIASFATSGAVKWGTCSTSVAVPIAAGSWLSVEMNNALTPPPDVAVTYTIAYD